jgi:hypothetical protein
MQYDSVDNNGWKSKLKALGSSGCFVVFSLAKGQASHHHSH